MTGPELAVGAVVLALTLAWPIVAVLKGVPIEARMALTALAIQCSFLALGFYARFRLGNEGLARLVIVLAYYFLVITGVSNLVVLRFPVAELALDPVLQAFDDALGYSWPAFVVWMAEHPGIGNFLALTYNSSLFQILALFILLAAMRRDRTLYRMVVTGILALTVTVGLWMAAPSFGPAMFQTIPAWAEDSFNLITMEAFRQELQRAVTFGAESVPNLVQVGYVAFPSFHTSMALLVVFYARGTILGWPAALMAIPMFPAILGHGAHYTLDVAAGIAVFAVCVALSHRLVRGEERWPDVPALAGRRAPVQSA